jgi:hypothetical protein
LGLAADFKMGAASQFLAYNAASAEVPLNGAGWQAAYAPLRRAQAFIGGDTKFYSRFSTSADVLDSTTPWAAHYTTLNKPAASDVDAVSASQGGTFQKKIAVKGNGATISIYPIADDQASYLLGKDLDGSNVFYVGRGSAAYNVAIYNYKANNGLNLNEDGSIALNLANGKTFTVNGQVVPSTYANFDARYMGKTDAYTKTESDARYAMSPNVAGFGGVGTYAFLSCNSAVSNGANVAGASLFSSGIAAQKSSVGYGDKSMVIQGSAMAGTWKCLGNQPAPSGSDVGATLYYRIA